MLCAAGVITSGGFVAWRASTLSEQAISDRAASQLISVREIKKDQVSKYFHDISEQLMTFADDVMIIDAMQEFEEEFDKVPESEAGADGEMALKNYYTNEFSRVYRDSNQQRSANALDRLNRVSESGKILQAIYIGKNANPLGSKHLLDRAGGDAGYHDVHKEYHSSIRHFLEAFGYYDIFLVTLDGDIVYSVFKELDYGTNLLTGPYANSGLAEAFNQARTMSPGQSAMIDFKPYYPSYESAASFMASPIDDHRGGVAGVLVFQMPVDRINDMMTFSGRWASAGLGNSGETYLVGDDKYMRSQPRFLLENKAGYLNMLSEAGYSSAERSAIEAKESAIGLQKLETSGTLAALSGQTGVDTFIDYRGVEVMSAYTPIELFGHRWALMSEIDKDEALKDVATLRESMLMSLLTICIGLVFVAAIAAYLLGSSISKPVQAMIDRIIQISDNKDLTLRLPDQGKDEMSSLGRSLNGLFGLLQNIMADFASAANVLNKSAQDISKDMSESSVVTAEQSTQADSVSTAVNEMAASVQEVAQFAGSASTTVQQAEDLSMTSSKVGEELGTEMGQLLEQMAQATSSIERLSKESESIGEVLDVIQSIAEQTNLLALNAAIEAARAGEQGRGFAVVADEVRSLASRTQASTEEIRTKIEALQKETREAVGYIDVANQSVTKGTKRVEDNGAMLQQMTEMIININEMSTQIATAAEEQSSVTEEISGSITAIADSAVQVSEKTQSIDEVVGQLSEQSVELHQKVDQFKF